MDKIEKIKNDRNLTPREREEIIRKLKENPNKDIWLYELDGLQIRSSML